MDDILIECIDCENDFLFSIKDQDFYKQQGFEDPKRCKECRSARKSRAKQPNNTQQNHANVYNQNRGQNKTDRVNAQDNRPHWSIICTDCNENAMVPFEPQGPARCKRCHWNLKNRSRQNYSHAGN